MRNIINGNGRVIMEITASQVQQSWKNLAFIVFVPHREENYQQLVEVLGRLIDLVGEDESFLWLP